MKATFSKRAMIRTAFATAFLGVGGNALACSGPGARRAMMVSLLVGLACAGSSITVVLGGRALLRRRSLTRRANWLAVLLIVQPMSCMGVSSGDCGYVLRTAAPIALGFVVVCVGLVLSWPRGETPAGPVRRATLGALIGAVISLPTLLLFLAVSNSSDGGDVLRAVLIPVVEIVACAVAGILLSPRNARKGRVSIGLLLLAPVVLAPYFLLLRPKHVYDESRLSALDLVIVDDRTNLPIPGAAVRYVVETQRRETTTGADGVARLGWSEEAQIYLGPLGQTRGAVRYSPEKVQVEAPGYAPHQMMLSQEPALGSPSPPSVMMIRLIPVEKFRDSP